VDAFKISVANVGGTRAYGYLCVPRKGKPPFPVSVSVPGAGPGWAQASTFGARRHGAITLQANVHVYDIPPYDGEPVDFMKIYNGYEGGYTRWGRPDKKKYFFYRAILGIDRLIGYVASRPDADRTRFEIAGTSQGGGLALILGGLNNDKFTMIWSDVAGMCDHAAYRLGRETSWPGLVPHDAHGQPPKDPAEEQRYREFSAYFDAVNFARRIKCPTLVGAGLGDDCCKAANIYSAYNVIRAPKRIFTCQGGHPVTPRAMNDYHDKEWDEAVKKAGEEIGRAAARDKDAGR
jgi:cephalosporin-C deacetylase